MPTLGVSTNIREWSTWSDKETSGAIPQSNLVFPHLLTNKGHIFLNKKSKIPFLYKKKSKIPYEYIFRDKLQKVTYNTILKRKHSFKY